jgi:hypothetical protein
VALAILERAVAPLSPDPRWRARRRFLEITRCAAAKIAAALWKLFSCKIILDLMEGKPSPELVDQAERELDETKVLVQQQFGIVNRLKRLGADCKDAILLLINLLELHEARERRLAQLRLKLRRQR